ITAFSTCAKCPGKVHLLLVSLFTTVALLLSVTLVYNLFSYMNREKRVSLMLETKKDGIAIKKAITALSILLSYFQVISQLSLNFDRSLIPDELANFSKFAKIASMDMSLMLNVKCLSEAIFDINDVTLLKFRYLVTLPWMVVLTFFVLYKLLLIQNYSEHRRKESSRQLTMSLTMRTSQSNFYRFDGYRKEVKGTLFGVALFFLVVIHPIVGTGMLEIFSCVNYYNIVRSDTPESWLVMDTSIKCWSTVWWLAASAALVNIVLFTVGLPCILFAIMKSLRRWHKIRIHLDDAQRHVEQWSIGNWKLISKAIPITLSQQRPKIRKRPKMSLLSKVLSADRDGEASSKSLEDSATENFIDLYFLNTSYQEVKSSQLEPSTEPDASAEILQDSGWRARISRWRERATNLFVKSKEAPFAVVVPPTARELPQGPVMRPGYICMESGVALQVMFHEKETQIRSNLGNSVVHSPVLRLDHQQQVLGQFYDPFMERFYYWQCWDMIRCLWQTSMVVIVRLAVAGDDALPAMWTVLVSFVAVLVHMHHHPYKNTSLDTLQFFVLLNHCVVYLSVLYYVAQGYDDDNKAPGLLGHLLVLLQLLLLTYGMSHFMPAFWPVVQRLKVMGARSKAIINHGLVHGITFGRGSGIPSRPGSWSGAVEPGESQRSNGSYSQQLRRMACRRYAVNRDNPAGSIFEDGKSARAEGSSSVMNEAPVRGSTVPVRASWSHFVHEIDFTSPDGDEALPPCPLTPVGEPADLDTPERPLPSSIPEAEEVKPEETSSSTAVPESENEKREEISLPTTVPEPDKTEPEKTSSPTAAPKQRDMDHVEPAMPATLLSPPKTEPAGISLDTSSMSDPEKTHPDDPSVLTPSAIPAGGGE
ncbi:hypothetical protein CYMTET_20667, partial [Cymbomonas tetramitiformis]